MVAYVYIYIYIYILLYIYIYICHSLHADIDEVGRERRARAAGVVNSS